MSSFNSIQDIEDINAFIIGMNRAFKQRSNDRIPFEVLTYSMLEKEIDDGFVLYGLFESKSIIGGLVIKNIGKHTTKIMHVWMSPDYQGKGLARKLICEADREIANQHKKNIIISVAHCYKPALRLYEKCGFKPIGVTANEPNTYYFIDMIKVSNPAILFDMKRKIKYIISKVKFGLLFDEYSTPNALHRRIYGKKTK